MSGVFSTCISLSDHLNTCRGYNSFQLGFCSVGGAAIGLGWRLAAFSCEWRPQMGGSFRVSKEGGLLSLGVGSSEGSRLGWTTAWSISPVW